MFKLHHITGVSTTPAMATWLQMMQCYSPKYFTISISRIHTFNYHYLLNIYILLVMVVSWQCHGSVLAFSSPFQQVRRHRRATAHRPGALVPETASLSTFSGEVIPACSPATCCRCQNPIFPSHTPHETTVSTFPFCLLPRPLPHVPLCSVLTTDFIIFPYSHRLPESSCEI